MAGRVGVLYGDRDGILNANEDQRESGGGEKAVRRDSRGV